MSRHIVVWVGCLMSLGVVATAQEPDVKARLQAVQNLAALLPEGARVERDVAYVSDGHERQKLDLYIPPGDNSKRPLIVWVHGGGWKQGSKEHTPAIPALSQGCVVASINYRLSQHAPFPAQIQDCQAAIRWLRGNAEKYGIDPDRIGVWGASAGGHLVALLGTASDTDAWEKIGEHRDQSAKVQCVVDWFGPADFSLFGEIVAKPGTSVGQLIGPIDGDAKEKFRRASPVTYITHDDPPFLIMHGDQDKLVPLRQSEKLRDDLKAAGVTVELVTLEGAAHGGAQFLEEATRSKIRGFFAEHLHIAETK
ncbi:MAG TPA: alpha/beta hydrolase [Planctomycetaceae bacterium]|nr:alpha/beta hydrolase [Planctomycetaceae bacterium]